MMSKLKDDFFGNKRRFRLEYGNLFYQLLWRRHNVVLRMLYILIPFCLFGCYLMMLITSGVLPLTKSPVPLPDGVEYYSFFFDLTNSFVLPYLLFFIYFTSGKYISYLKDRLREFEELYIRRDGLPLRRGAITALIIIVVSVVVGAVASQLFISNAVSVSSERSGEMIYWYYFISDGWLLFYRFLIFYVFSKSVHFFLSSLVDMFILCSYKKRFNRNLPDFKGNKPNVKEKSLFKDLRSCFMLEFFFGFYYLIAIATVFYSDIRAYKYFDVDFALAGQSAWYILLLTIFLSVLYFGGVYIARVSSIEDYERPLGIKINSGKSFPHNIDIGKILVFVVTTVLPAVTPLLQSAFIIK